MAKGVGLTSGVPIQISWTKTLPTSDTFTRLTLDLARTANSATVTFPAPKPGSTRVTPGSATATVRAWVDEAQNIGTVCGGGTPFGPFTINWNPNTASGTVDPPAVDATPTVLSIINTGAFSMCIEITPNITATVDLEEFGMGVDHCNETPVDLGGNWSGTFTCNNSPCGDDINQPIQLSVTHNQDSFQRASYTDGGANYNGTVCGQTFHFNGGDVAGTYTESGTLRLNGDGTATKTSNWVATDGSCSGQCQDQLTRAPI
jgi:hypothetical protein